MAGLMVLNGLGAWWDEDHKLVLLHIDEFRALSEDTILRCITGAAAPKTEADADTRGGFVAFGFDVL